MENAFEVWPFGTTAPRMVDTAAAQLVADVDEPRMERRRTRDSALVGPNAHRMVVHYSFLVGQVQVGFALVLGEIKEMGPFRKEETVKPPL